MAKRMTIVFDDENLYTELKVAAARTHRPAKDIVAEALQLFFEATPDEYAAIVARTRMSRGTSDLDGVLQELGLKR